MIDWIIGYALVLLFIQVVIVFGDKRKLYIQTLGGVTVVLLVIPVLICYFISPDRTSLIFLISLYAIISSLLLGIIIWSDPPKRLSLSSRKKPQVSREAIQLFISLDEKLKNEKMYLDPNLKVKTVANSLHVSEKVVSSSINEVAGENFNSFINGLRIEEAKQMIMDPKNRNYTIDAIAELSGFSNKVSFYSAFKKKTGCSPTEFKLQKHPQVA